MAETAQRSGGASGQVEQSSADQAKEKVQETAQQVQEKAREAKGQAGDRVRQELDTRSTQAGSQLKDSAEAMRRTGDQLRGEGKETPAKIATAVADRAERLGGYMSDVNADQMLRDVENFARRQPLLFALGGATLGFLAARFMKASSSSRYQSGRGSYYGGGRAPDYYGTGQVPSSLGDPERSFAELPGPSGGVGEYGDSVASAPPLVPELDEPASPAGGRSKRGGGSGRSGQ